MSEVKRDPEKFIEWVLEQFFEGWDIEGGSAQDKALELGIIRRRTSEEITLCPSRLDGECPCGPEEPYADHHCYMPTNDSSTTQPLLIR